jgi:death-on-curing protein
LPSEPCWLTADTAIAFNRALVAATGEPHFVRDAGLLESACARPQNMWAYAGEEDMVVLASALGIGIALNHPFGQGNKRTGFACAIDFLETNGFRILGEQDDTLGRTFEAVIADALPEEAFIEQVRQLVETGADQP